MGITEVADIVGKSRQNMRKLLLSGKAGGPTPVHEGSASIWHLAQVLEWLRDEKQYAVEEGILDVAKTNMQLNVAAIRIDVDPRIKRGVESMRAEA